MYRRSKTPLGEEVKDGCVGCDPLGCMSGFDGEGKDGITFFNVTNEKVSIAARMGG
jgi:hypothetical protein